ncbi:MAG: c-type cytochrome biogenesis protein CcmI [Rhodobacter sp.]|nr:c-type cytochrome biogenesis protein CcmI [Rhodobacter sp.]
MESHDDGCNMLFWLIAAALTLAVAGLLVMALMRARAASDREPAHDVQVYRDQLREVERDLARGVVTEDEAGRVRVEISRRLLEADKAASGAGAPGTAPRTLSLAAAGGIALVLVGGALGLYAVIGAPGYSDLPLKTRIALADAARADRPGQAEAEEQAAAGLPSVPQASPEFLALMDRLRAAVAESPDDLQGQELLARNEARLGNFSASHLAQARVIELKGDAAIADDYGTLADLMVLAAGGYVSPEAEAALTRALELEPRNGPARYYTGLLHAQTGRPDLAFRVWRALLAESRPDAPWVPPIEAQIRQMAQLAGERYVPPRPPATPTGPGPSAADMAAAAEMSAEDREAMIRGMVDGLAERLADEGGPPQDWARLIGALGVLGETERAGAIWAEAQEVFADAPQAVEAIRQAARNAGVAE